MNQLLMVWSWLTRVGWYGEVRNDDGRGWGDPLGDGGGGGGPLRMLGRWVIGETIKHSL